MNTEDEETRRPRTTSSGHVEPVDTTANNSTGSVLMHDCGIPGHLPATKASETQKKAVIRFREHEGRAGSPPSNLNVRRDSQTVHIDEVTSPQSLEYDNDYDNSSDDEIQYCDCIAAALQQSLPGTPGRKGIIPYMAIYDSQTQARRRGYWIPGVPVNAKIVKVERNTDRGIHFINTLLYTIELEHGQFRWSVVRNYQDFTLLNNRLKAHRARQQFMAPIKRFRGKVLDETQERFDNYLEYIGIDIIPDHKPDCPYSNQSSKRKRHSKLEVLKRESDCFEESKSIPAPLASFESPGDQEEAQKKVVNMQQAVQSGILEEPADVTANSEGTPKRQRRQRKKDRHTLPRFPMMPDSMVTNLEHRKELLENWLQMVLHIPINRNHHETAEFLEVSRFSFVNELGGKHTEGFVKKRPGGSRVFLGWKQCCVRYLLPWSKRWLMVRDSFVAYMDHRTEQIRMVLLMDRDFKVAAGGKETEGIPTGLIITNTQHELHLKCRRIQDTATWKYIIEQSMAGLGNVWLQPHRFSSSYPVRENCYAKWFVDAKSYMEYAADMMELAREEIFITDWWLSPEIYMKRPALEGNYWRLDEILKRKAEQGVKIFILLYKEMEMALGLNSIYTKRTLQGLHENIKVMRHPDHYPSTGTFFWAHHEKILVIDQLISFVGGVDLCFGRWDDHRHVLTDLGSVQFSGAHQVNTNMASGLRSLMTAPLTLSPLGLEDHETVSSKNKNGERNKSVKYVAVKEVSDLQKVTESAEEVDLSEKYDISEDSEVKKIIEETALPDKEAGGVVVRTLNRFPVDDTSRHSSPADLQKNWKEEKTTVVESTSNSGGIVTKTTTTTTKVKIIKDNNLDKEKIKKDLRRAVSSLERQRKNVPLEILDRAGPAPTMIEKAAKSGMDFAQAAEKYKEYVASGAVQKEKHRAQTPPNRRKAKKDSRITRAVGNWKSNRAKRKWKQMLESDEVTMGYELDWLRLREMDEKVDGDDQIDGGVKLWYGKDYVNYIAKDFVEVDMPFHDFIDRGTTPRMPWHDIHSVTFGAPARDLARHFIQRWNATKTEKLKDDSSYPYLLPKSYENVRVPRVFKAANASEMVNVQVLRSLSNWSGLINQTEDSIQMAYLSLIANSKHYIYIENQFFVSMIESNDVTNEVCKVIYNRVVRAYKEKENYRVYIMIPLLPGFEGDVGAPGGSSLQAVLHWTYRSLSQGPNSLFQRLKTVMPDPSKYIHVGSLRTYDQLGQKLVSELIYIHCKLLIVDDESVIIGSANINDRSQCGNRDSEVCCVYTDVVRERSVMNGKPYEAGRFAKSLRMQCMREHLGLLPDSRRKAKFPYAVSCDDPVADSFYVDVWQSTAKSNAQIYEEVFRSYPTDLVETFEEFQKWTSQIPISEYSPQQAEERVRDLKEYHFDIPSPPKPLSFEMPKPPILQPNVAAMLQKSTSENLGKSEIPLTLNAPAPSAFKVVENPFALKPKSVLANTNQPSNNGESKAAKAKEFSQIEESNDHPTAISEDVIKKPEDEPLSVSKPEKPTSLRTSPATTEIPITPMTEDDEQITSPAVLEVSSATASDLRSSNVFTDKIDMSGGLMSWLTKTVIESKLLNDVAEKARSSVETVITTLDPGMKPFLAEHGVIEFALFNCDSNLLTVASDAFTRAGSMAICRSLTFDETAFIANFRPLVLGEQKAYKLCEEKIEAARKTKKAKDEAAIVVVQPFLLELSKRYYSTCKIVLHHGADYFDAISQPLEVPTTIVDAIQRAAKSEGLPDEEYSISVTQAIRSVYKTSAVSWEAGCFAPYDSNELLSFAFSSVAQQLLRNLAPVN